MNECTSRAEGRTAVKTVLITGANRGIGCEAALALARMGYRVALACRDTAAAERVGDAIAGDFRVRAAGGSVEIAPPLDLGSFDSVRVFARDLRLRVTTVDVLVNNAGAIFPRRELSVDGFERSLAVNFLGPFLLTRLLLPLVPKGGRIVNVASVAGLYGRLDPDDLGMANGYGALRAYARSKMAVLMVSRELAERQVGKLSVYAVHPGIANTRILTLGRWFDPIADALFRPLVRDARSGAAPIAYLASSERIENKSGSYFSRYRTVSLPRRIVDPGARSELWALASRLVGLPEL